MFFNKSLCRRPGPGTSQVPPPPAATVKKTISEPTTREDSDVVFHSNAPIFRRSPPPEHHESNDRKGLCRRNPWLIPRGLFCRQIPQQIAQGRSCLGVLWPCHRAKAPFGRGASPRPRAPDWVKTECGLRKNGGPTPHSPQQKRTTPSNSSCPGAALVFPRGTSRSHPVQIDRLFAWPDFRKNDTPLVYKTILPRDFFFQYTLALTKRLGELALAPCAGPQDGPTNRERTAFQCFQQPF